MALESAGMGWLLLALDDCALSPQLPVPTWTPAGCSCARVRAAPRMAPAPPCRDTKGTTAHNQQ